jgi:hypothetical protein
MSVDIRSPRAEFFLIGALTLAVAATTVFVFTGVSCHVGEQITTTGHERWLWAAALVAYGVGDTVTTMVGVASGKAAEAGPLAGPIVEAFGLGGLIALKIAVLVAFYAIYLLARTPGRVAVPLALALVGGVVTVWNLLVLL